MSWVKLHARQLGMPRSTLEVWLKRAGWFRGGEPSRPLPEDPQALKVKVAELQRQVRRLEMEKEILKKATAYFASQSTSRGIRWSASARAGHPPRPPEHTFTIASPARMNKIGGAWPIHGGKHWINSKSFCGET